MCGEGGRGKGEGGGRRGRGASREWTGVRRGVHVLRWLILLLVHCP